MTDAHSADRPTALPRAGAMHLSARVDSGDSFPPLDGLRRLLFGVWVSFISCRGCLDLAGPTALQRFLALVRLSHSVRISGGRAASGLSLPLHMLGCPHAMLQVCTIGIASLLFTL